jgi:hypothetical protein
MSLIRKEPHYDKLQVSQVSRKLFQVFKENSVQIPIQSNQIPCIRPNDVIFRPDDKNFPSEPSSMSRSFELPRVASVWMSQQHDRTPFSVRQGKWFRSKTQIWEDSCNRPDDVCSRPNAILDKASRAYKVQPSGRQSPWSGRASLNMEIVCRRSPTFRTLVSMVQTLKL